MDDELLKYYNDELAYMRRLGAEFSERHPKIAGRLKMNEDSVEDPHVSRLLEGFAFLTARISHRLDDDFPELAGALMGLVAPDYQAPVPSMAIAEMTPANDLEGPLKIGPDHQLMTDDGVPEPVIYAPAHENRLWPLKVAHADFQAQPFQAPGSSRVRGSKALLRLDLECTNAQSSLESLAPDNLRFYLRGSLQQSALLFERLLSDCNGIILSTPDQQLTRELSTEHLAPYGLDPMQAVVPYGPRQFNGQRLLAEYFLFPQKFLFVELRGLAERLAGFSGKASLYFYFRSPCPALENRVDAHQFLLNAVPLRNYFRMAAEPQRLELGQNECRIVADHRREPYLEIHHIESVTATDAFGEDMQVVPLYQPSAESVSQQSDLFWQARRRAAFWSSSAVDNGSETYLTLVNRNLEELAEDDQFVLNPVAYCLNRDLPGLLPFGSGAPRLDFVTPNGAIEQVHCLTAPTPTRRVPLDQRRVWQLLTHLTLNSFSGEQGLARLKQTLALFNITQSPEHQALIDNLSELEVKPATARLKVQGRAAVAQGADVDVLLEQDHISGQSLYPFICVLDRFFAEFCAVNRFTRLRVHIRGRAQPFYRGPARNGGQVLL